MSDPTNALGPAGDNPDLTITAQPEQIAAGGIVLLTASLPEGDGKYAVRWIVVGPVQLSEHDARIALLGATTVTGDEVTLSSGSPTLIRATLDTGPLSVGSWQVGIELTPATDDDDDNDDNDDRDRDSVSVFTDPIQVTPRPFAAGDDVAVTLKRTAVPPTADQALWVAIRNSTNALGFNNYSRFLEAVICDRPDFAVARRADRRIDHKLRKVKRRTALPFPNVDRYRLLKAATEVFLMTHCGVDLDDFSDVDLDEESRRLNRTVEPGDLEDQMRDYLTRVPTGEGDFLDVLPYLGLIRLKLRDVAVVGLDDQDDAAEICYGILAEKLTHPCFLELIHEYWYDEGYVVRTLYAISRRFQNRTSAAPGRDPLRGLNIDPLRPLNNLLWGLVQDRQHRLSTERRAEEYAQEYGLVLASKPGPPVRVAEARSRFIEAFHHLMSLSSVFYSQDDNTTVIADPFGVLNALKETHVLLTEGAHNQYGDLPWTARHEMLMYQWILSRPEVREFLPTRTMVVSPEDWMDRVDAMNRLQGWSDIPVLHFRELAVFGEQLLLGIRYGDWTNVIESDRAGNWARYWRPEVQGYIHAYRAVTGVDLTQRPQRWAPGYHPRYAAHRG
jgi:hypothetical protein